MPLDEFKDVVQIGTLLQQANEMATEGNYEGTIRLASEALKQNPQSIDALYLLAGSHFERGEKAEALAFIQQLLKIDSGNPQALRLLDSINPYSPSTTMVLRQQVPSSLSDRVLTRVLGFFVLGVLLVVAGVLVYPKIVPLYFAESNRNPDSITAEPSLPDFVPSPAISANNLSPPIAPSVTSETLQLSGTTTSITHEEPDIDPKEAFAKLLVEYRQKDEERIARLMSQSQSPTMIPSNSSVSTDDRNWVRVNRSTQKPHLNWNQGKRVKIENGILFVDQSGMWTGNDFNVNVMNQITYELEQANAQMDAQQ